MIKLIAVANVANASEKKLLEQIAGKCLHVRPGPNLEEVITSHPHSVACLFAVDWLQHYMRWHGQARLLEFPALHRTEWDSRAIAVARMFIQQGTQDLDLDFWNGALRARPLIPF